MATATVQSQPTTSMQGIAIPASSVNPPEFFRRTRRHTQQEGAKTYDGNGHVFELRKSDILSEITVRFVGSVKIEKSTGTVASTARWPYDFFRAIRFAANGASNLMNCSGAKFKVRDIAKNTDLTDRGVEQTVGGASRTQGTLAQANEEWGVGSNTTGLAAGTYDLDFEVTIPVAEDQVDLSGAIFLQTSSADLTLSIDYETVEGGLFAVTGDGAATITGQTQVWTTKFDIPVGPAGEIVVPDLSAFHSMIQSRYTALQTGENEVPIVGAGAGKALLRLIFQHWNGSPSAPLAMTDDNFGLQAWRYATNETPDQFHSGSHLRKSNERTYNCDIGGLWGFGIHEFSTENAFRDVVDLGTTAELRLVTDILSTVTLTSPAIEYVMETVYSAAGA